MATNSVYVYEAGEFGRLCGETLTRFGYDLAPSPAGTLLAVAPCLRRKLARAEYMLPELGTLVFHPSLLPYHRGPDAIRWAVRNNERVSGITWFWADHGLDTGPICEQEIVRLVEGETPGAAYRARFIPAGLRAFERAVAGVRAGLPRRVPQSEAAASYESFFPKG